MNKPSSDAPSDPWAFLRRATPARIALGRAGDALPTHHVLEFQLAHARARDAVHTPLDDARLLAELADLSPILVESRAQDRVTFLQKPDLGRLLAPQAQQKLHAGPFDAAIVIADGLSAAAVQGQAVALCRALLARRDWRFAPPVVALQARVALGDEIAALLDARMAVMLIGERPGLSAADSLGAYITFDPKPGRTTDAERNCVSNIRSGGLTLDEAARRILAIMTLARRIGGTGTLLKEDDALALLPPTSSGP